MIYFDMNIYNRIFDDQNQLRIRFETSAIEMIFSLIDKNIYKLCWSFMLEDENNKNPFIDRKNYIRVLSRACKIIIPPSENILNTAKLIMSVSNAKAKDALHVSCAIECGAKYFITCDDRLIRTLNKSQAKWNSSKIKIMNPIDFLQNEVNIYASE